MKNLTFLTHLLAWTLVLVLPTLLFLSERREAFGQLLLRSATSLPFLMVLFYSQYIYLIDKFLFEKKYLTYLLITLALVLLTSYGKYFLFDALSLGKRHRMPPFHAFFYFDFLTNLLPIAFAIAVKYAQQNLALQLREREAQSHQLQTQLDGLKYQLQPHFFFNALNNIYSLIAIKPEKAQESVHSLSKLMRHFMQKSAQEYIPLSDEIDFLRQYIDLMRLRLTDKTRVVVDFPRQVPELHIAPLLFISLVENAFKHGVSTSENTEISFRLLAEEGRILFYSENDIVPSSNDLYSSGIGIDNLQKRLALLYPDRHRYEVAEREGRYYVTLEIIL